jgi:alanine dehydrogenase
VTLLLTRSEIAELLPMTACIDAVEAGFAAHDAGRTIPPGVLGAHVHGGGFHVKTAGMIGRRGYFVAKVNANFPGNPGARNLPTIQGALILFDATDGAPLAIMDSAEITRLRTAAASAVAARLMARADAAALTICGCGVQGRVHLEALRAVRPIREVFAYDVRPESAATFATEMSAATGLSIRPVAAPAAGTLRSDIVVTCSAAREPFLGRRDLRPGTFVAAVGADAENKQELSPDILAHAWVVADILDQCAKIGELHHAIDAGVMTAGDVGAELAAVVAGKAPGRRANDEITVFDSTGTALEDVAAAAWTYERAITEKRGTAIDLQS